VCERKKRKYWRQREIEREKKETDSVREKRRRCLWKSTGWKRETRGREKKERDKSDKERKRKREKGREGVYEKRRNWKREIRGESECVCERERETERETDRETEK
jgi:hypothetical protein